jgi:hypothetical protein
VLFLVLLAIVLANIALEFIARWRHPPIGQFLEIEGVHLHYIETLFPNSPPRDWDRHRGGPDREN